MPNSRSIHSTRVRLTEDEAMPESTYLYLLIFPDRGIMKIGKANGIHERIQALRPWWGEVDYDESYHLAASPDMVFSLERTLHFLLSSYATSFDKGDEHTELFSLDGLPIALQHIELFCSSGAVSEKLSKGISRPPAPSVVKRRRGKHAKYRRLTKTLVNDVSRIAEQFGWINRLLIILLRRQSRIAFQYEISEGYLRIGLQRPKFNPEIEADLIRQNLSFNIEDFTGWCGYNCCSWIMEEDIIQYTITIPTAAPQRDGHPLIAYFAKQSMALLSRLPLRSAAALEDIPKMDENHVPHWLAESIVPFALKQRPSRVE